MINIFTNIIKFLKSDVCRLARLIHTFLSLKLLWTTCLHVKFGGCIFLLDIKM